MKEWVEEDGRVLTCAEVAPGHGCIEVLAPGLAARALPGQFAMARSGTRFLARPLSFFDIDPGRGVVAFLVRAAGEGTRALLCLRPGDGLGLAGPFGNGFPLVSGGTLLLVAGGVGVAPFPPVVRRATAAGTGVRVVLGARTAALLLATAQLRDAGAEVVTCTEDGSGGVRGTVSDALPGVLRDLLAGAPGGCAFACGPPAMLVAVARLCEEAGVPLYVSLEARMGCGFGVCRGCAVPAAAGGYLHVCQDGPVFPARAADLGGVARLWEHAGDGDGGGCA
ncbi:MAG: dihydroorotate dehydrogenase electron transfer subunit [Bacillota bacterium]|nr:dihydroorotate dehydrogenase electron transfer subunit [Bacillota bacterium]